MEEEGGVTSVTGGVASNNPNIPAALELSQVASIEGVELNIVTPPLIAGGEKGGYFGGVTKKICKQMNRQGSRGGGGGGGAKSSFANNMHMAKFKQDRHLVSQQTAIFSLSHLLSSTHISATQTFSTGIWA